MAALYPSGIDSLPTNHADNVNEKILAATVNNAADAINKIETELGTVPKGNWPTVKDRLAALETLIFNALATTVAAYTLVLTDATKAVVYTKADAAGTITIPPNSSVAFPIGTQIIVRQGTGALAVTVQGGTGVTVFNPYGSFTTAGPGAEVKLLKIGADAWSVNGEVA